MDSAGALILGLLGAGHCLGMCGGFAAALTYALKPADGAAKTRLLLAYNAGRISSYALAGALMAWLYIPGLEGELPIARTVAGLLLIAAGFYLADIWRGIVKIERIGQWFWRYLQPLGQRLLPVATLPKAWLLGMLWGWLPCGLVYSMLALAATQASPWQGAAVMLAFGLGTVPAVLAGGLAFEKVRQWLSRRAVKWGLGIAFVLYGVWTLSAAWYHVLAHGDHGAHQHGAHQQEVQQHEPQHHESHQHESHQQTNGHAASSQATNSDHSGHHHHH